MNYKAINILLAILLFVSAILTFDWNDWTHLAISTVLFLSGLNSSLNISESPEIRRLGRTCQRVAAVIAVFVIAKLLIFG